MLRINLSLIVFFLFVGFNALSQRGNKVEFYYDNGGNRTERSILVIGGEKNLGINDSIVEVKSSYNFKVYPNVTETDLFIELDEDFLTLQSKEILLFGLDGVLIEKREVKSRIEKMDMSGHSSGSYLVRLTAEGGFVLDWRIIKM